jgi:hypothetical protein
MRILLISLLYLLIFPNARAQQADSVYRFVDSALDVMEHRSFYAHQINWKRLRDSTHQMAAGASSFAATFPALAYAFDRLGDKHGWLVINDSTHYNKTIDRSGANPSTP